MGITYIKTPKRITYIKTPKQPWEEIPVEVTFINRLPEDEPIQAATVTCADKSGNNTTASTIKAISFDGPKVFFTFFGGISHLPCKITVRALSATTRVEEDIIVPVVEY